MKVLIKIINTLIVFCTANLYNLPVIREHIYFVLALYVAFVYINVFPCIHNRKLPSLRLRLCGDGCELLLVFLLSSFLSAVYFIYRMHLGFNIPWTIDLIVIIVIHSIIFWNGILRVYLTSLQLGIKWRLIGILCGWIPFVHLVALLKIISVALKETAFESAKIWRNQERQADKICSTKYPIMLVHGVFFRDFRYLNYWGRIPEELKKNGAVIYYGNQQSAASVEDCGKEISERIQQIMEDSGCEKVNIIAHSKGGLDCRCAISKYGADKWVASLTTINTPHRGCLFAEYLLSKLPQSTQDFIANRYNAALKKFGDASPDFLAAVTDLTASSCQKRNEAILDAPGVFYQSVGSKLNKAMSGKFPLNFSYHLVKYFDGLNDGLVSIDSFVWGQKNTLLTVSGNRGISHGDMIDLNRENIDEFDVREFYVNLVHNLKENGF